MTMRQHHESAWTPVTLLLFTCCALGCDRRTGTLRTTTEASSSAPASVSTGPSQPVDRSRYGAIVVLGSSTAAGIGPKNPENAWVSRYHAHLSAHFPNVTLLNLAVGGQTTFEIQPTGYVPPPNRPTPVEGKNITAALAFHPRAIIVNLPSNDQANNYPISEQLANYDRIASLADAAHVPLWVSTPQPRNFTDSAQLESLMRVRDALAKKFAPRTLDFWTPFATREGLIKAIYNAGDGTHLNDAAHALLVDIVESARIPERF